MDAADEEKVATNDLMFDAFGTVAVIVVPEIVAVTIGFNPLKLKAVIAFSVFLATVTVTL